MKKTILLLIFSYCTYAQTGEMTSNPVNTEEAKEKNTYILPIATMAIKGSHPVGISMNKTIHIIFPHEIKEVDSGIPEILTQITPSFNNVLKVKASDKNDFVESNLTVLTASGDLYSFIVNYQEDPEILNINIEKNFIVDQKYSNAFNTSTFNSTNMFIPGINLSEPQIRQNFNYILSQKKKLKNIGVKNLDVAAFIQNIYMDDNLLYAAVKIDNKSGVTYPIDFIKLYIRDVETAKRQTIQEEELPIIKLDNFNTIEPGSSKTFVIALPRITISSDKQLDLEIYEKKGGRHLRFPINSKIVSNAKTISQL